MKKILSMLIQLLMFIMPWPIRRIYYISVGFKLERDAYIGFSLVLLKNLKMYPGSRIGHLNFIRGLEKVVMHDNAILGNLNWITAFDIESIHFKTEKRNPSLIVGNHAAITNRHYIDCQDLVHIDDFATFAGVRSQIFTHSIDIYKCRQACGPVYIGKYSIVGSGSILLPGSTVPDRSILSAGSVLRKGLKPCSTSGIYSGNPAVHERVVSQDAAYFQRITGVID